MVVAFNVEANPDGDELVTDGTVIEQSSDPDYELIQLDKLPAVTPTALISRPSDLLAIARLQGPCQRPTFSHVSTEEARHFVGPALITQEQCCTLPSAHGAHSVRAKGCAHPPSFDSGHELLCLVWRTFRRTRKEARMFPNPQAALPLPPRPSIEQYRKLAKDLVKAFRSADPRALAAFADRWIASLWRASGRDQDPRARRAADQAAGQIEDFARRHLAGGCSLGEAQFVVARSHGFLTWARFMEHLDRFAHGGVAFEAAADAVVAGDEAALRELLAANPGLARAKSDREHGATLLIYTSANGVEGYRQRTPANIVRIAEILVDAGVDIEATADVYGGDCTTLGLAATSAHPRLAGVQLPLLQLLLDRGARVEGEVGGNGTGIVLACLGNGCPEAAAYLADRGARVQIAEAAGLGRRDAVERLLADARHTPAQLNHGLRYACVYGRMEVAELLVGCGADLADGTGDGQTPAHMAVIGGHLETLKMLLAHNPPVEQHNAYAGTVLGQTLWSAGHGGDPDRYIAIIDALLTAGAKLPDRHVPVNAKVDAFLLGKGSRPEPAWHWFGEKPRSSGASS